MGTFTVHLGANQQSNVAFTGQTLSLQASNSADMSVQFPPEGYGPAADMYPLGGHSSSALRIEFTPVTAATYELNWDGGMYQGMPNYWLSLFDATSNNYVADFSYPQSIEGTLIAGHLYRLQAGGVTFGGMVNPGMMHSNISINYTMTVTEQATPVPVPPTVWLLGAGLVGLVGMRRRFEKKV